MKPSQFLLLAAVALGFTGCRSDRQPDDGKTRIVATTTMIADMAAAIVGDTPDVEIITLMGPGVDPHTYNLPARALGELYRADVVLYNGHHLEGKSADVYEPLRDRGAEVLAVGNGVPAEQLLTPPGFDGHADPHVWGDPALWGRCVKSVVDALVAKLPDHEDQLRTNGESYVVELADLHVWAKSRIAEIPEPNRVLITSHDAFNYFGLAYGLEVIGIQGISTESEAGIADITATADLIKERGVKAIFTESSVNRATIERIAGDTGAKIGGELYSDSLGPTGTGAETYVGMIKHNVNTIVEALK